MSRNHGNSQILSLIARKHCGKRVYQVLQNLRENSKDLRPKRKKEPSEQIKQTARLVAMRAPNPDKPSPPSETSRGPISKQKPRKQHDADDPVTYTRGRNQILEQDDVDGPATYARRGKRVLLQDYLRGEEPDLGPHASARGPWLLDLQTLQDIAVLAWQGQRKFSDDEQ